MMRQLSFGFIKEAKATFIIKFPPKIREKLIKQMATAIIEVNKKTEEESNDSSTNK